MREKLIELVRVPIKIMRDKTMSPTIQFTMPYAEEVADNLIANGVIIPVRCEDCKHRTDKLDCGNYLCNRKMIGMVRPSDFCSFGERKENA